MENDLDNMHEQERYRVLDLFSGIGGFSLGLERTGGFKTVAFCEIEDYARKVLNKHWPGVPIYEDVRELTDERLRTDGITPDVITGGFPCQDISLCGHGAGIEGERSGLWKEIKRLIRELRPQYAIMENVSALLNRGMGTVIGDLAEVGYDAEWHCILPQDVGIPSLRDRVWILSYPAQKHGAQVVDTDRLPSEPGGMGAAHISRTRWSVDQCRMGRGVDGIPDEVYRFEGLGNSVVPQIPELIGRAILESERYGK